MNANFQGKKVLKENASYKCLLKSANKKYYPQILLEECKYEIEKKKMDNLINDHLDLSSSDESDNESEEYDSDTDSD